MILKEHNFKLIPCRHITCLTYSWFKFKDYEKLRKKITKSKIGIKKTFDWYLKIEYLKLNKFMLPKSLKPKSNFQLVRLEKNMMEAIL